MENLKEKLISEISSLESENKITKQQSKFLAVLLSSQETSETLIKNHSTEDIRTEILKIVGDVSYNLYIPPHTIYEDLSSPMDSYLLLKKKQACRSSNYVSSSQILKKLEKRCN